MVISNHELQAKYEPQNVQNPTLDVGLNKNLGQILIAIFSQELLLWWLKVKRLMSP